MLYKSINNAAHTRNNRIKNHLASSVIKRKKERKKLSNSLSLSVKRINRFLQSKNGRSIRDPRAKKFYTCEKKERNTVRLASPYIYYYILIICNQIDAVLNIFRYVVFLSFRPIFCFASR